MYDRTASDHTVDIQTGHQVYYRTASDHTVDIQTGHQVYDRTASDNTVDIQTGHQVYESILEFTNHQRTGDKSTHLRIELVTKEINNN